MYIVYNVDFDYMQTNVLAINAHHFYKKTMTKHAKKTG